MYVRHWKRYVWLQGLFALLTLLWVPTGLFTGSFADRSRVLGWVAGTIDVLVLVLWAGCGIALLLFPCPRCGRSFGYSDGGFGLYRALADQRCKHCGLAKYADK